MHTVKLLLRTVYVESFEWQNLRKFWKLCDVFENKVSK